MNKEYYDSLSDTEIMKGKTACRLKQFFSDFEIKHILRRYNVGTAVEGKDAWWFVDETGTPYALTVDNKDYGEATGIWNERSLYEYNSFRVGVCESPEQAFWANMYLRHYAVWIYCGMGSDLSKLNKKSVFAIVSNKDGEYSRLMRSITGIRFYEYSDFKEELFKTGVAPKRYVLPPSHKNQETYYSFIDRVMNNPFIKKLSDEIGLELT